MLINRKDMKRKRRDDCSSPLLDDSPKRTKVHAQRKFAQGSNVNSPVITPVKELEKQDIDVMPEPVELLPIKRPNTEDFLTFLCFRGTPILPPSLNFFNTASIVDTNGQVHEIKSESPKNGPIDTSQLTKSGSGSAERPFIAFGVRKRADPIVISRQMDKKRRHALALQALRRKYQEQKMAKIRAVTISKLSEKVTNKTLVRSNSISKSEKSETVTKKTNTIQKTKVNVVETPKQVKVTRSVKAGLRPQIKQKMCLRSFRGRFVQRELQFRNVKKRAIPTKKLVKKDLKVTENKEEGSASDYSSDDEKPLSKSPVGVKIKSQPKVVLAKIVKKSAPGPKKPAEISFRITRSNKFLNTKVVSRRQQIKQRMLMTTPKTIVKPRTLRSHSAQKGKTLIETKQKIFPKTIKKPIKSLSLIKESSKKESSPLPKKVIKTTELKSEPKENPKKDETNTKKETQSTDKKVTSKTMEISKKDASPAPTVAKSKTEKSANVKRELENAKEKPGTVKKEPENMKKAKIIPKQTKKPESINDNQLKKEILSKKKPTVILKKEIDKSDTHIKKEPHKKETNSETEEQSKSGTLKSNVEVKDKIIETKSQRPTRRTKEAAAIYMEILSHKLVNESRIDDDNVSIDSFPELPNVKKTEQRENELKAKAGCSKNSEGEDNKKVIKSKEKDADVSEMKVLRSSDKKKVINTQKHNEETDKNTKTCEKVTLKQNEGLEKNTKIIEKNVQKQNDTKVNEKNVQKQNDGSEKAAKINEKSCQKQCESSDKNVKTTEKSIQKHNENVEKNTKVNEKNVQKQSDNSDKTNVNEKTGQKINECFTQNTVINEKIAHKSNEISDKNTKLGEKIVLKQSDSCDKNTKISEKNGDKKTEAKKEDEGKSKKVVEEIKKIITKTDSVKEELVICDRKTRSAIQEKIVEKAVASPLEKVKEIELKVHINPLNVDVEGKKNTTKIEIKEPPAKKKCAEKSNKEEHVEPEASIKQSKNKKTEDKSRKNLEEASKRQTRNSSQNTRLVDSDDSDESFHVDIRIPRKKQNTRSKVSKSCESDNDSFKSVKKLRRNYKECSSSESDRSTTSDVNVKPVKLINNKNKKFTKTRGQQKADQSFSDSDEEPLSKLTQSRTTKSKEMSISTTEATNVEKKVKVENETVSKDIKAKTDEIIEKESFKKPKRECAKRPQNYLPMFSSSDEEEYFHGFVKSETKPRATKIPPSTTCTHLPSTSDLSYKDIGRRFGKGKVNMSTEQIEKWLKDAAMAGSSVKNENDAMLKFGEKIPTETSHSVARSIDTEKLKSLLITSVEKQDSDMEKKLVPVKRASTEAGSSSAQSSGAKPLIGDRKLIFRNKDKGSAVSNVNAFSASNENSVYAFGEEAEDVMKTPFRRPTRRPSSTGTSKSEDESSKFEELPKAGQFRKPPLLKQDSTKSKDSVTVDDSAEEKHAIEDPKPKISPSVISSKIDKKPVPSTSMVPPTMTNLKHSSKQASRSIDVSDELKYKVPSSPSASSSSSAKLYKRQTKFRVSEVMPVKLPDFPGGGLCAQLVEAPTFHPTEKEFQDPLEYIEKIRSNAEQFGICRIVPPSTFKPECKVTDDMRFTAYNQYVHKMLHRWGPNFKELMAIKKYLSTQNISLTHSPWIGGMEVDLPRLYQTVQSLGGLKEVIEKKKWPKVSDAMKIPKSAQDRVTKLDDIYCKYLLPYDTLSPAEREKLFHEVETEWAKRESKSLLKAQQNVDDNTTDMDSDSDDEAEECIVKGRNMALNAFYRIARNTMSMWFKTPEPLAEEVEQEFWKHVNQRQNHICVHSGSIDSGSWGYGFAVSKNSPFARHAWNLKVLTNNSGSVLRSIGPVMGVTVPTLHVGMVFSSCCWYRDPHSLPWIEYLHTGGNKIWYGIPDSASAAFHAAMKAIVPNYCRNKSLWLPSDTVMVPPSLLVEHGVSLSRIVQEPGQFIVVFPKVFTSSLSTGYVVSESVYFAPPYWLKTGRVVFNELRNSCEPSMFSLDRLLLSIVSDSRSNVEVLKQIIPAVQELCDKEKSARDKIKALGVSATEKLPLPEAPQIRKKKKLHSDDGEYECEICRMNLFVSMVTESQENAIFCLEHAAEHIEKKKILSKHCKLTYTYDDQELEGLVDKIKVTIVNKMQKKVPNKFAGMPTLLGK